MKKGKTRKGFYEKFHDPSKAFESETRSFCYNLSLRLIHEANEEDGRDWYVSDKTIQGIVLLLYCWNFASPITKTIRFDRVRDLIRRNEDLLRMVESKALQNFDRNDFDAIRKLFRNFTNMFGQTGASKALSLLNPGLFVMWDTKIRAELRKEKPFHGIGNGETPEKYLKFLLALQEVSRSLKLANRIPKGAILAKKLDEYNYIAITRKEWQKVG